MFWTAEVEEEGGEVRFVERDEGDAVFALEGEICGGVCCWRTGDFLAERLDGVGHCGWMVYDRL